MQVEPGPTHTRPPAGASELPLIEFKLTLTANARDITFLIDHRARRNDSDPTLIWYNVI